MALALILRNANKLNGLHKLSGVQNFSQFTSQTHKGLSLVQKVTPIKSRPISLTPVRRSSHGDHSTLWNIERALSIALLGIVPATVMMPCAVFDNLMAITVVAHSHWGLEAIVIDYVRPIIFGNVIPKVSLAALYLVSISLLGGLLYFNFNDVGIGRAIRMLWGIKAQ